MSGIRYRRGPPMVRNMCAVLKKASWGTRRIFRSIRCKKQAFPVRKRYSVPKTAFCGTRRIFKVPQNSRSTDCGQPPAHRTHFQRRTVPKAAYCRTGCIFSARNGPRSEVIRLKRGRPLSLSRLFGPVSYFDGIVRSPEAAYCLLISS